MFQLEEEPLHIHSLGGNLVSYVEDHKVCNHEIFMQQKENVIV